MTPGQYLYLRRRAANLSREDLALRIDTSPAISCMARMQLLVSLEAGLTPMRVTDAQVLAEIPELAIDLTEFIDLIDATAAPSDRPRIVPIAIGSRA